MMKKADNTQSKQSDLAMQLTPEPEQESEVGRQEPQLDVDDLSFSGSETDDWAMDEPAVVDSSQSEDDDDFEFDDDQEDEPSFGCESFGF